MIHRRRRRPEPDNRPDWRDPDMPVLRGHEAITPREARGRAAMSMYSYDVNPRAHRLNWRHDPLYSAKGHTGPVDDTPTSPQREEKAKPRQSHRACMCGGSGIIRRAVFGRHEVTTSPRICDTPMPDQVMAVEIRTEEVPCPCGLPPYRPLRR